MTCHIRPFANITDFENVKKCVYAEDVTEGEDFEDESWNWGEDESSSQASKENWLEDCLVSLSPTSELLVIAKDRNLVILNAKWESDGENEGKINYILSWNGDITHEISEKITSIICIPIAGQGKLSVQCGADWTAIAVGFTSGAVRFYTEKGALLLSEVLHDGSVKSLKFQSYQPSHSPYVPLQVDELHVAYDKTVCCVHGFALCNTLKACRNQLARVQANCSGHMDAPSLAMVKWALPEQDVVSDVCVLGSLTTTMFGHLTTASLRGGFSAIYRTGPPQISTVLSAGVSPYFAWHCIVEGNSGPVLSDVAKAVASKFISAIESAVPGWLVGSGRTSEDKPKELEQAESMACRFGLCDKLRKGERVYISPQKNLSAVCDSLGRVILIDNLSGLALRFWKGYRDAECAFIQVDEDKCVTNSRKALYLAIYAPKKGIIEVWALQQGPKIAVFQTSKNGRLLYIKHGLMGANNISLKSSKSSNHPCIFLNSLGEFSEIIVPFHSILSNKTDPRNKDMHLFKQVKKWLNSKDSQSKDLIDLCNQVVTNEIRFQILEEMVTSKNIKPELLQAIVNRFMESLDQDSIEEGIGKKCWLACDNLLKLLDLYMTTNLLQEAPPHYGRVVPGSPAEDEKELCKLLKLSESDIARIFLLTNLSSEMSKLSVKFQHAEEKFSVYLESFSTSYSHSPPISFSPKISTNEMAIIGEVLCQCVLYGTYTIEEWLAKALASGIDPKSLMHAVVSYWLKKPLGSNVRSELGLFMQILQAIISLVSLKDTFQWWEHVRHCIMESKNLANALTATIISRAVYLNIEAETSDEDTEWETITRESCLWSQIMVQIEASAMLQLALSCKPKLSGTKPIVPVLEYTVPEISLSQILSKGPGLVTESVAKWISSWGLPSDWLDSPSVKASVTNDNAPVSSPSESEDLTPAIEMSSEAKPITTFEQNVLEKLSLLREYFPHSLSTEFLISNITWEYIITFSKEPDKVDILSTALTFLNDIKTINLKLGMCIIIWNAHLKTHFENITKLLHKIGKLPKERLCRQHLNMSDTNVKHVLKSLNEFFTIFIETQASVSPEEMNKKQFVPRENLWTFETTPSLVEIAFSQDFPNIEITTMQNRCVSALRFLAILPIRLHRPVTSLFNSVEELFLWLDLKSKETLPVTNSDPKLDEARISYLIKVINAAIEAFPPNEGPEALKEMVSLMSQCFVLANEWGLPTDGLRIQTAVKLYSKNCDICAREIVRMVKAKEQLGSRLLIIVGERMKTILSESKTQLAERLANLSPSLNSWIKEQKESSELCDMKDVYQLATLVVNLLPENSRDHKLAVNLLDAIDV